jgi:hypothetical protein
MILHLAGSTMSASDAGEPLWRAYYRLNEYAWTTPSPAVRAQDKFFFRSVAVVRPWKLFGFEQFCGYKKAKLQALIRNYLPPEQIPLALKRIRKRIDEGKIDKYLSVGLRMGTGLKDTEKKTGECIGSVVFNFVPKRFSESGAACVDVQVFFRVSEVTIRLLGDFIFIDYIIRQVLGPLSLLGSLNTVTMYFSSYYVMLPLMALFEKMAPWAMDDVDVDNDSFNRNMWEKSLHVGRHGTNPTTGTPLKYHPKLRVSQVRQRMGKIKSLFYKDDKGRVKLRPEYEVYRGPLDP